MPFDHSSETTIGLKEKMSLQPIPYLSFDGNCREAMSFYQQVLGGEITVMMTGGESPIAEHMAPGTEDRILNAQLVLPGGNLLYGGDCWRHIPYEGVKGVSFALQYDTVEEAEGVFAQLSVGGEIGMPISPSFWAKAFGMVTDKFGVTWVVNGEMLPMG